MSTENITIGVDPFQACTIIIATLGLKERGHSLERAIQSVRAGNRSKIEILVIVNGNRFDPQLVESLRRNQDIRLEQIDTGSLTAAILTGRQLVATPFFGFLDDDDEYLPGAVDQRLSILNDNKNASVVVTNGYRNIANQDHIAFERMADIENDPLKALFDENWLASCGGLYRTSDLPVELFQNISRYLEWTWLAFQIALSGKTIVTLDTPTFRIHDTEGSESKSNAYQQNQIVALERMLHHAKGRPIQPTLQLKLAQTWHDISYDYLRDGSVAKSWSAHLKSLKHRGGWRYLMYTRHLLLASLVSKSPSGTR